MTRSATSTSYAAPQTRGSVPVAVPDPELRLYGRQVPEGLAGEPVEVGAGPEAGSRPGGRRVLLMTADARRPECQGCRLRQLTVELAHERDEVARQAAMLAERERLKSDFFADVSHKFRTPLTLILGPLRDLLAGTWGELPREARQQVDLARSNAERLVGLVEQILDTARLEAGWLELRVRRGDLVELLADLAAGFHSLAERHGLRFHFAPPDEAIPIWADPDQLEKVFANLLANAMRYTRRGGRVEMTVGAPAPAGTVSVTVRDEGPGIDPADQERIFERFYRAPDPTTRGNSGIGLGLPLARQLTELHGGRLTVRSVLGEGSAFRVKLRLGRDHFTPGQIVEGPPWPAGTPSSGEPDVRVVGAEVPGQRPPAGDSGDRTTVLVVEDHPDIRSYVRRHLEAKYRVEEAADGAEGLARARDLLPDLVVSDVRMPEMDGYTLCRALKQDPELDWVPVVLLTARAAADDKLAGLGEGADDYLTKPFDVRELVARVDNLIASRRRLRERFANGNGHSGTRLPLAPGVRLTPDDRHWLERVRKAVEAGFDDDAFTVATLAERLAVHRSRLHRRLRQLTGTTPLELIAHLRLERAAALLKTEAISVSEIAYASGFQSLSHFSRRFRERFGQSPSEYRQSKVA